MTRPYRAPNKRLIHRSGSGRFRKTTLSDIGLGVCDKCGKVFVPNLSGMDGPFIDPREFNARRRTCGPCLGLPELPPAPEPPSLMSKIAEWFDGDETGEPEL
jgi:hypothetical protein